MFTSSFDYSYINCQREAIGNRFLICHNYSFKGKRKRYIVRVEQYDYQVYIVKFYLAEKKSCALKYNNLSNENEASRVLTTCAMVMMQIQKSNPFASFGFVGSTLPNESKNNTKRFGLYSKIMKAKMGVVNFQHEISPNFSAYILINRNNTDKHILESIQSMFVELYDYFDL